MIKGRQTRNKTFSTNETGTKYKKIDNSRFSKEQQKEYSGTLLVRKLIGKAFLEDNLE